ncbi:hypothetical protein SYNTR_0205 [Candidatus Syntrophocurvum alkaliphilum]|uniref:DUF4829 domain-containing protein n=1 Tax=Candidatus Syntrophocurvum alkaliphilum TaxID=2293317 RepID=A0A6I6DDX6_9FIRM|nr:hypothetical protein [Candidatus Syntrophocurvum alkaliphilum]QGT98798.1 hypothetical protein SYNTR_0205 [Candidatus Syntrophocurvum alkaliphilum]
MVEEAKECLNDSQYVISKEEWSSWKEHSEYSHNLREKFNWDTFKDVINHPEADRIDLVSDSATFLESIRNFNRNKADYSISVDIFDEYNNLKKTNVVNVYLELVEGEWKVVGG